MNIKKSAIKSLVILFLIIGVCIFFSGTIKNILTPKVQIISPKKGKLTKTHNLFGRLDFSKKDDLYFVAPEMLIVDRVLVRRGDSVKAGDTLFLFSINEYKEKEERLKEDYANNLLEIKKYDIESSQLKFKDKEKKYIELYSQIIDANKAEINAMLEAQKLLPGIELPETGMPDNAGIELQNAINKWREKKAETEKANEELKKLGKFHVSYDLKSHIEKLQDLNDKLETSKKELVKFYNLSTEIREFKAPNDGYIVEVNFERNSQIMNENKLCTITKEDGVPFINITSADPKINFTVGQKVTLKTNLGTYESTIADIYIDENATKCLNITMPQELLDKYPLRILDNISYETEIKSETESMYSLVPINAIHGDIKSRSIYVVDDSYDFADKDYMKIKSVPITVVSESEEFVAVSNDISKLQIVYMEDREIMPGSIVMGYSK